MPSDQDQRAVPASYFVAALGAAMAAANYPVTMVCGVMEQTSCAYGVDHQFLALPHYVQIGSTTGQGICFAEPDVAAGGALADLVTEQAGHA